MTNVSIYFDSVEYSVPCFSSSEYVEGFVNKEVKKTIFRNRLQYDEYDEVLNSRTRIRKVYSYIGRLVRIPGVKMPRTKGSKELDSTENLELYISSKGLYNVDGRQYTKESIAAALKAGCFALEVISNLKPSDNRVESWETVISNDVVVDEEEFDEGLTKALNSAIKEVTQKYFAEHGINL